jgi:xylan 1,4-beta-xylosidase
MRIGFGAVVGICSLGVFMSMLNRSSAMAGDPPVTTIAERGYSNPIVRGLAPDPSVCRVGDNFYLATSTMGLFPGVPIMQSRDLIHWKLIGHALTRPSQFCIDKNGGSPMMFAPTLRYHSGKFFMITTDVAGGGNFFVTATDPAGPWSDPIFVDKPVFDPSLFFDADGKTYYTRRGDFKDRDIVQAEIDPSTGKLLTPLRSLGKGMVSDDAEAPHLFKHEDWYYLTCAEGGSRALHMQTIGRSKSPWGPFEHCPANPIISQHNGWGHPIHALGHADFFDDNNGNWWAVCLGTRHAGYDVASPIGRETFLFPVAWKDGWPTVDQTLTRNFAVPAAPLPPAHPWPALLARDDFEKPVLDLEWTLPHYPRRKTFSLTDRPGFLRLLAQPGGLANPDAAFVGRRQTEITARFTAAMDDHPTTTDQEAGVSVFQTGEFHYDLFRTIRTGQSVIVLRKTVGDITAESAPIPVDQGPLLLRVTAEPLKYGFAFSTDNGTSWHEAGTGRVQLIGTEVAAVWSGVLLGTYASGSGSADVDWCEYVAP